MLSVIGNLDASRDALWCTFRPRFQKRGLDGIYLSVEDLLLDQCAPAVPWVLPPPDGRWRDISTSGKYGPCIACVEVGYIVSSDEQARCKPCDHSTLDGAIQLSPEGLSDDYGVLWTNPRYPSDNENRWFYGGIGSTATPTAVPIAGLMGKPTTLSAKSLFDNRGIRFKAGSGIYTWPDLWHDMHRLETSSTSPSYQQSSESLGVRNYCYGDWLLWDVGSLGIAPRLPSARSTKVSRCKWSFPKRNRWVCTLDYALHSTSSYTPAESLSHTGIPYAVQSCSATYSIRLVALRSVARGIFELRFETSIKWDHKGYHPYEYVASTGADLVPYASNTVIMVLHPGRAEPAETPKEILYASTFCKEAPGSLVVDPTRASNLNKSRLAALSDTAELQSNWIENSAQGIPDVNALLTPLKDGAAAAQAGNIALASKALASAYLVYKYTVAPTISDVGDVKSNAESLLRNTSSVFTSLQRRRGIVNFTMPLWEGEATCYTATTYYMRQRDNRFARVWRMLEQYGLEPSAGNAWDLVPFSFVLDWFVKFGDMWKNLSAYNSTMMTQDVAIRCDSFSLKYNLTPGHTAQILGPKAQTVGGPLVYKWYKRVISTDIGDVNPFSLEVSSGLSASQMMQGAALITVLI